jgi:phage terminase large subunit-like protein
MENGSREAKVDLVRLLNEKERRQRYRKIKGLFPDKGDCALDKYPVHKTFFENGRSYRERLFCAANQVGKTTAGAYETTLHLTGEYPANWKGARFSHAVDAWCVGETLKTTRDVLQLKLLGEIKDIGTGLIPQEKIVRHTRVAGVADAVDMVWVKHVSGGVSVLGFKSFDQGRESFQGTVKHWIWLDEEPPADVYSECLLRTISCDGKVITTFTPMKGHTEVVEAFFKAQNDPESPKFTVIAGWDHVPHLSEQAKKELLQSIPPFQREARSKGIPTLGSGAIYPVAEEDIFIEDFAIPVHWPKAFALDVGWNRTAAVWGALDRENDVVYLYAEHYRGQAEPVIHAQAIKARGKWIPGVIDPASCASSQKDGEQLLNIYRQLGLTLTKADNTVEAGIYEVWGRLSTGRLKVFKSLTNWKNEFRLYRRDEKGKIIKENDHLMDATRYLIMSGLSVSRQKPLKHVTKPSNLGRNAWMAG